MTKRISKILFLFLVCGLWSMVPSLSFAADYHLDAMSIGQVRKNVQDTQQIPVNGYFGAGSNTEKWDFKTETNMRVFRDFDDKTDKYDLYQTLLHFKPAEMLQLDMGRQFVNQGFSVEVLDGLQTTLRPADPVFITAFSGIPRSIETRGFHRNDALLTGMTVGMKKYKGTTASLHGNWRKNNVNAIDFTHNDEILVGGNVSHQFQVSMTPMVYGASEYDTTGKVLEVGTVGLDIYPSNKVALNVEGNYFNANRALDRRTIESIYSKGRLIDARFSSTFTLVPNALKLVENYSYENMEVAANDFQSGHRLDAGLQFSSEQLGLQFEPSYYFIKSFGGKLNGIRAMLREQFNDALYAQLNIDFTKYKKITNDNDNALSFYGWTGYEVLKGFVVSGGFEYNKNNLFDRDARGSFRLDYHFDNKS